MFPLGENCAAIVFQDCYKGGRFSVEQEANSRDTVMNVLFSFPLKQVSSWHSFPPTLPAYFICLMTVIWKHSHFCPILPGQISLSLSTHLGQEQSSRKTYLKFLNYYCVWEKASDRQWTYCKGKGARESHLFLSGPDGRQVATATGYWRELHLRYRGLLCCAATGNRVWRGCPPFLYSTGFQPRPHSDASWYSGE